VSKGRDVSGLRSEVERRSGPDTAHVDLDAVLFAVGRAGNIDELAPQRADLATEGTAIVVDHRVRTNVGHVFAAGDVNARSMLVHVARLEGRAAADNAVLESDQHVSWSATPSGIEIGIARYEDLLRVEQSRT
jgi:pyruvate/2-oxoglutarate dehydrogenase complex dihydrolipoamide dehydrogenase (E3) component